MTEEQAFAIWLVGTVIFAIAVGVIARHDSRDRSFAILSGLWPILAVIAAVIGTFWALAEFGAWLGRKLPLKFE